MEVVHPRIPRALGWRCLNSSSAVRSPRRSIFRDVLHDGIRVPLFPHVHFFSWATCYVCIFLLRSFSNDRVCRQTWGPPQALRLVASPRLAAPATARPPANGLDLLGLPRTAPGPVSGRLTPTSRRAGTTPPHPSAASVPSPADTVLFLTSTPVHCPSHVGLINLRA